MGKNEKILLFLPLINGPIQLLLYCPKTSNQCLWLLKANQNEVFGATGLSGNGTIGLQWFGTTRERKTSSNISIWKFYVGR